jgi:excisionase family DNA binding protein
MAALPKTEYYTPKQVAEYFGVTLLTVQNWIKKGKLPTVQPAGFRGRQFIRRSIIESDKLGL